MNYRELSLLFKAVNRDDPAKLKRPLIIFGLLSLLIIAGTIGFRIVGESSWLESLYFAVITLTTLGCRDPASNPQTMLFVVVYLSLGLGLFSYSLFSLGKSLIEAEFRTFWRSRRMLNRILTLNRHYIVCGQGRMGMTICNYLDQRNKPFVVIDHNEEQIQEVAEARGWLYLTGDATDDDLLRSAGIERAQSLATVLPSDADNVYVILSARLLNSDLQIVARASDDKAIEKMERAGATRVISPFSSGGTKIARLMLNPSVDSFFEIASKHEGELELVEFQISADCPYIGKKLSETNLRDLGVIVLGIRCQNGDRLIPPPSTAMIHEGDSIFVFGNIGAVGDIFNLGELAN